MRTIVVLAMVSCAGPQLASAAKPVATTGTCTVCAHFGRPHSVGVVQDPLIELSGLVASRSQPGVLYAHNDSGDIARFFALSATTAAQLAEFTVTGADAVDWEDIALGPCPAGTCVYLGDIGDNRRVRDTYEVYRVPEPAVDAKRPGHFAVNGDRLRFVYPNGERHNAEALVVHPTSGRIYVVTKEAKGVASRVYRFPAQLDVSTTMTLEKVADLKFPKAGDTMITGADVDPCGASLLVRMYNRLVRLRVPSGRTFEEVFTQEPQEDLSVAQEPQGEAVAFSHDGHALFTASERSSAPEVSLSTSSCLP